MSLIKTLSSSTKDLFNSPTPNTITLRVRVQYITLGASCGYKYSDHSMCYVSHNSQGELSKKQIIKHFNNKS